MRQPAKTVGCPTCGGHSVERARKGDIARVKTPRWTLRFSPHIHQMTEEERRHHLQERRAERLRLNQGRRSIRVYWPSTPRSQYVHCPDPYHKRDSLWWQPKDEVELSFLPLNVHARPHRLEEKRKAKARRHKEHQSKAHR